MSLGWNSRIWRLARGGEIGAAAAPVFGHLGEATELARVENAAGNAHAEHERILCGSDVKEAEVLDAEAVVVGWWDVGGGVGEELVPDCEGVLLELPEFFAGEVFDGGVEAEIFGCGARLERGRW